MIITTQDGSHSIYSEQFGEAYHSKYGALQESQHVFIEAGLKYYLDQNPNAENIHIFEMGFGTGLNALLSFEQSNILKKNISYTAIEAFPIENWKELNHQSLIQNDDSTDEIFVKIHNAPWNENTEISNYFTLKKIQGKLEETVFTDKFDIIYYDAFAPAAQEHLWTIDIFTKLHKAMNKGGVLTTYCAKGYVKRNLKAAGFTIQSIPGPIGKREMTRAVIL